MEICLHTDKVDITPEEAGYKQAKLDCLDDMLVGLVRDNKLHGASYLLSREGRTFAARSMGKLRHTDDSSELTAQIDSQDCFHYQMVHACRHLAPNGRGQASLNRSRSKR